jgi:hypothetical protein
LDAFKEVGVTNKCDLAIAVAVHILAFERAIPLRKPWKMGLFDAAALALTFFQKWPAGNRLAP